ARICRKATGWYLQLATRHDWLTPDVKMPDVAVSVDPGVRFATSTDYGRQIKSPKFLTKQCKRLRREQRRASRRFVKGKKSENQSQNWKKQQKKIAKLHEKVARQRNAFWHKDSTYFVTNFGGIAIEDNSFDNMGRKAKPKPREDGKGYERNNAKAKSGLNRSLKDVACGKFKVMVAAKAKIINNEIHLVASHYNSQTCSNCGHVAKENRKTQSSFKCVACGHSLNADINAAINIYNRADWSNRYKLHPKRQKLSERRDTPVSIGGIDESQKPASAYRLPLGTEGQQEGDLSPRSEITEQPNPARGMNTGNRQIEARSKTPEVYQNPETHTQLDSWNSSA
ncbi:MAG: RNA-guided endonuclease TnpB family protein, partial [Synechocystis sp.]